MRPNDVASTLIRRSFETLSQLHTDEFAFQGTSVNIKVGVTYFKKTVNSVASSFIIISHKCKAVSLSCRMLELRSRLLFLFIKRNKFCPLSSILMDKPVAVTLYTVVNTVDSRYLEFGYLEYALISK